MYMCVSTIYSQKYFIPFISSKKSVKLQPFFFKRQNTLSLEQQIYTSPEYSTQPLVVMVKTFRRSVCDKHILIQNLFAVCDNTLLSFPEQL